MNKKIVGVYSMIHFIVDLACAILASNLLAQKVGNVMELSIAIILYNFFAFAIQLPIGIIADRINKNAICSAVGCLLIAIAYGLTDYAVISCVIAGIGNSLFHVGGGIDVLNISEKKAKFSGIFVSTGAMGIFLGAKSVLIGFNQYYIIVITLILSALLLLWLYSQVKDKVTNEKLEIPKVNKVAIISIICLIITVIIRSYVGMILAFEWKADFMLALISIFAVVLGKMLGGIIGDKIGLTKISLISLLISAILFIFAFNNSILGILAILFFNMTMPITLIALSNMLNKNKGMAFGLLTFALFIGSVPVFLGYRNIIFNPVGLCGIAVVSAIILYLGIKNYYKVIGKGNN